VPSSLRSNWRVLTLVSLPFLVYFLPACMGLPITPGDNRTQNFPLRELVGMMLRSGHLPLYTPDLWSGYPILAGWNAGAAYPLTWLFIFLPPDVAWGLNQALSSVAASLSMYALLSRLGASPTPSMTAGLLYTYWGAMIAQNAHFPLVSGCSFLPLAVLSVLELFDPKSEGSGNAFGWTAVLSVSVAMMILSAEPRAVDIAAAVLPLAGAWFFLFGSRRRAAPLAILGLGLGIGLSMVQVVPGLEFVRESQRAAKYFAFFAAGSLPLRRLELLLIPAVLGGSGSFHLPRYFADYSLDELNGYMGLLAYAALFSLPFLPGMARRWRQWGLYYLIAAEGLVMAIGGNAYSGRLLYQLPYLGSQRLQSRNILISDFALAVVAGLWLDAIAKHTINRRVVLTAALPLAATLTVASLALGFPGGLARLMNVPGDSPIQENRPVGAVALAIVALYLTALIVAAGKRRRLGLKLTYAALAVDGAWFLCSSVVQIVPSSIPPPPTQATAADRASVVPVNALGIPGRFIIYDPGILYSDQLEELNPPDQNAVVHFPSIQGYTSVVDQRYAQETGTHGDQGQGQNIIDPQALSNGVLDQLSPGALVVAPDYLIAKPEAAPPERYGSKQLHPGESAWWFFGTTLKVREIQIPFSSLSAAGKAPLLTASLLDLESNTSITAQLALGSRAGLASLSLKASYAAQALVVSWRPPVPPGSPTAGIVVDPPIVVTAGQGTFLLDGILQQSLSPRNWRWVRQDGPFAVFRYTHQHPFVWAATTGGGRPPGVRVLAAAEDGLPTKVVVSCGPAPCLLYRSAAFLPGSFASARAEGTGRTIHVELSRADLIQMVRLPAGSWVVSFGYRPPGLAVGAALTGASAIVLFSLCGLALVATWRQMRSRNPRAGDLGEPSRRLSQPQMASMD
jgi:hypothetical protein